MTTSFKKILIGSLVVPAVALAAACTSGSNDNKAMSADSGSVKAPLNAPAPADGLADESGGTAAESARDLDSISSGYSATDTGVQSSGGKNAPEDAPAKTTPETQTKAIISKGQVSLRSKDLDKARFELQKLLDGWNGTIANEQSSADKKGHTDRQRLELRIPSKYFGKAMDELSTLPGTTLVDRSRTSEDVTTQVIDNNTRVRSQKLSLARVQQLLARASTLNQIIMIESQLSQRQADLESLEQQQKFLADQTSMSTINLYLEVPGTKTGKDEDDDGFFSGLSAGWDHLGSSTTAVLTGIGAVLPFAVLIGLIGFPLWSLWRRRTPKQATEAVPAA
jgi:hypothetical protein